MSNHINLDPTNDPGFPIGRVDDDTEGHARRFLVEDAGEGDTVRARKGDDTDSDTAPDTEGHGRYR